MSLKAVEEDKGKVVVTIDKVKRLQEEYKGIAKALLEKKAQLQQQLLQVEREIQQLDGGIGTCLNLLRPELEDKDSAEKPVPSESEEKAGGA